MVLVRVGAGFLQVLPEHVARDVLLVRFCTCAWKVTDGSGCASHAHVGQRAACGSFGRLSEGWGTSLKWWQGVCAQSAHRLGVSLFSLFEKPNPHFSSLRSFDRGSLSELLIKPATAAQRSVASQKPSYHFPKTHANARCDLTRATRKTQTSRSLALPRKNHG